MSKEIPTPYMWSYQPQMGLAAGAAQDYSTRINYMSAGPHMISRVNGIRAHRNRILLEQAAITTTPRNNLNPRSWPAALVYQESPAPTTVVLLQTSSSEPRSGGIGTLQFIEEFVPSVYFNPFSGPPGHYPDQFIPNFDAVKDSADGYD